ncbi:MAG: LamG-like jellyroll fold domain-containing protein, partial [bacterium]
DYFVANSTTSSSTFAGQVNVASLNITSSTATSTLGKIEASSIKLNTISGVLQAIGGYIVSALVDLASQVTGILGISNGGTGTSTAPAVGQILVGNSSGAYDLVSTSSLGVSSFSSSSADSWLTSKTTADLTETSSKLFFTDNRARGVISSVIDGIDYTSSTGQFTLASGRFIPLGASTTNWNSAFSWGNHAIAGYLTSYTEADPLFMSASSSFAKLSGATFSGLLSATNFSGTSTGSNTGDESSTTIRTKLAVASASNNGYLSSSDWSTFNGKLGSSVISSLTSGYLPKWSVNKFVDSSIYETRTLISGSIGNFTNTYSYSDYIQSLAISSDGRFQLLGTRADALKYSSNYGVTWSSQSTSNYWSSVAMSSDASKMLAVGLYAGDHGSLYYSNNNGANWYVNSNTPTLTTGRLSQVSMSSNGNYQVLGANGATIPLYFSNDGGTSWTAMPVSASWDSVAISGDGSHITALAYGNVYSSPDYGVTWTTTAMGLSVYTKVDVSYTGQYQILGHNSGSPNNIYVSTNGGANWSIKGTTSAYATNWPSISDDGSTMILANARQEIRFSNNYGDTWSTIGPSVYWQGVTISGDGTMIMGYDNSFASKVYVSDRARYTSNFAFGTSTQLSNFTIIGDSYISDYLTIASTTATSTIYGNLFLGKNLNSTGLLSSLNFIGTSTGLNTGDESSSTIRTKLGLASSTVSGYLSMNDWNAFNNKLNSSYVSALTGNYIPKLFGGSMANSSLYELATSNSNDFSIWTAKLDNAQWQSISVSGDGRYQAAIYYNINDSRLYVSSDFGDSWNQSGPTGIPWLNWYRVAVSNDGSFMLAIDSGNRKVYQSTDYGNTWVINANIPNIDWPSSLALSTDGQYQTVTEYSSFNTTIYQSSDYGATWLSKNLTSDGSGQLKGVAMSLDGSHQSAVNNTKAFYSTDYGSTWTNLGGGFDANSVAVSGNGQYQIISAGAGRILVSIDNGAHWSQKYQDPDHNTTRSVAISNDGSKMVAVYSVAPNNYVVISSDYGETWSSKGPAKNWNSVAISGDGTRITSGTYGEKIYVSNPATLTTYLGLGTTTPTQVLTISGNQYLTGAFYDSTYNPGPDGYILQSTNIGTRWVSTSSLGVLSNSATSTGWELLGNGAVTLTGSPVGLLDDYTKLLLHFNSNFTDSSNIPKTVTAYGTPSIVGSPVKFGAGSVQMGNLKYLDTTSSEYSPGSGDFTLDFWYYPTSLSPQFQFLAELNDAAGGSRGSGFILAANYNRLTLYSSGTWSATTGGVLTQDQWNHVAITRTGNTIYFYINGVKDSYSVSNSINMTSSRLRMGIATDDGSTWPVNGNIDEFRFSKGIARWTSDFTPETSEYDLLSSLSGRVGIGTTTPNSALSVVGSGYFSNILNVANPNGTSTFAGNLVVNGNITAANLGMLSTASSGM